MRTWALFVILAALAAPAWSQTRQKQTSSDSGQSRSKQQGLGDKKGAKQEPGGGSTGEAAGVQVPRGGGRGASGGAFAAGAGAAADEGKLVPVGSQALQGAEALVTRALMLPPQAQIQGQPLKLLDLASKVASRAQQQQAIEAYWQLAAAVARYTFRWDDYAQLEQLLPSAVELDRATRRGVDPALEAQLSAAQARLREAEAAVLAAQYRLVEAGGLAPSPLPLPADIPHVGPYNTKFQTLFAARQAPAQARLLDRLLPLRKRAIDVRAAAVQAALDAVDAAFEGPDGSADLLLVLRTLDDLARQRQAFVDAVLAYNSEIATYALAVAPPNTSSQQLVGMLIKLPGNSRRPAAIANQPGEITRMNFEQPLGDEGPALNAADQAAPGQPGSQGRPVQGEPTPADPATRPPEDSQPQPTDESSHGEAEGSQLAAAWPSATSKSRPETSRSRSPLQLAAAQPSATAAAHGAGPGPQGALHALSPARYHMAAFRQQTDESLYPALRGVRPARRAQQLAEVLHWLASHAGVEGEPLSLLACLRQASKSGGGISVRRDVLTAYWTAQQHAARLAVLAQQVEQLAALRLEAARLVTSGRPIAGGGDPVLTLWAAEQAAKADVCDAQAEWSVAQFALAQQLSGGERPAWYVPSTAPHAGSYRLKLEAQPAAISQRSDVQRLAQAIPALHGVLVEQAAAVVAADAHRAASPPDAVEESLAATRRLAAETLAFLGSVTDYNLHIADYALAVLGAHATPELLASSLVLPRADISTN